jgi:SAM-dependent methyltransferase
MVTPPEHDVIFEELGRLQRQPGCESLLQFRSLVTAHQYVSLIRLVERHVPRGARVLDWGCGNGHFSFTLSKLGYDAEGFAFEDFGLRAYLGDSYRFSLGSPAAPAILPFANGSFDAVVSVGTLEHVRETGGTEEASLAEIARVLVAGGRFICFHFPNRFSWIEALTGVVPGAHHHRFRYDEPAIRRLCGSAGLESEHVERYAALPRNMWHRAPAPLRHSRRMAALWDRADALLEIPLSHVCQNYAFVATKNRRASL